MDEQKQQLIERIRQAQNILVTVSANPSVDQLAAAIGLTLALNKLDKHGTAVFSGQVPSTIEFLKPEETLEKNTDSLRDFIIALDKSKADKLRYKVEDQVVRIFITPYKTSLSEADLNFSQGDFNVDVVIALGVTEQQDLDMAITAHGRILHDATVASVTTGGQNSLGTINWTDGTASGLSEMVVNLVDTLDKKLMDNQIATALLTGIVANTERFRNEKTTPRTMSASAELMAAGANPQLIATELEQVPAPAPAEQSGEPASESGSDTPAPPREPGTLEIHHVDDKAPAGEPIPTSLPEPENPQIQVDADGKLHLNDDEPLPQISQVHGVDTGGRPTDDGATQVKRGLMTEPPKLGDAEITANSTPEEYEPSTEELSLPAVNAPLLSHNETVLSPLPQPPAGPPPSPFIPQAPLEQPKPASRPSAPAPAVEPTPFTAPAPMFPPPVPAPAPAVPEPMSLPPAFTSPASVPAFAPAPPPSPFAVPPADGATLTQIEQSVDSPHVHISDDGTFTNAPALSSNVNNARDAVQAALNSPSAPGGSLPPISGLNATPLGPDLHPPAPAVEPTPFTAPAPMFTPPAPVVSNTGFSEPTPGNTPADNTLDMPLPSNPFGPGQQVTPPSSVFVPPSAPSVFPGTPPAGQGGQTPPPPVPPPMVPPVQ